MVVLFFRQRIHRPSLFSDRPFLDIPPRRFVRFCYYHSNVGNVLHFGLLRTKLNTTPTAAFFFLSNMLEKREKKRKLIFLTKSLRRANNTITTV
jgi:hypothetical protein